MSDYRLRPIVPEDGDALAALLAKSADGGRYAVSSRFQIAPWRALQAIHGEFDGVVAEAGGADGLVGAGLARYGRATFEGALRSYALLNTLVVHPDHRRRGLAAELAAWRVAHARARMGEGGVLCAGIQAGNTASVKTAARWSRQRIDGCLGVFPTPPRRRAPGARAAGAGRGGTVVRAAGAADWAEFASGLSAMYETYNLFSPETAESLAAWHADSPFDTPYRHACVAADARGKLVAGLSLAESARIRLARMVRMPALIRVLNHAIRLVPADGLMREVPVTRFWFRPGAEAAARRLWDTVRWEWRDRGSVFMLWTDPRSPLARLLQPPPWLPKSTGSLAVAGPVPMDPGKLLYPIQ
jgi:GNAT superfamily N-acetyltransferase